MQKLAKKRHLVKFELFYASLQFPNIRSSSSNVQTMRGYRSPKSSHVVHCLKELPYSQPYHDDSCDLENVRWQNILYANCIAHLISMIYIADS